MEIIMVHRSAYCLMEHPCLVRVLLLKSILTILNSQNLTESNSLNFNWRLDRNENKKKSKSDLKPSRKRKKKKSKQPKKKLRKKKKKSRGNKNKSKSSFVSLVQVHLWAGSQVVMKWPSITFKNKSERKLKWDSSNFWLTKKTQTDRRTLVLHLLQPKMEIRHQLQSKSV